MDFSDSVDPPSVRQRDSARSPDVPSTSEARSSTVRENRTETQQEPSTSTARPSSSFGRPSTARPSTARSRPSGSGGASSTGRHQVRHVSQSVDPELLDRVSLGVNQPPPPPPPVIQEEEKGLRLYMLTWNVGGSKPPEHLESLLSLTTFPLPHMYGIGLQEVNPRGSEVKEWVDTLTWILTSYDFVRVKHRQTQGIVTVVFVRRPLLHHCNGFESEVTRTGFGGLWGNKGGVSIRLEVYGVNVIIVNCHLAAHQDNVAERIIDYDSILDDQKFKDPDVDNILDHDYVFWMGDLNFRVDNMSRKEVDDAIESENYAEILKHDQLNRCRQEKLLLEDFEEMDITFAPTYKFDMGTHTYDTSNKQRIPSWCDRVLWHVYNMSYEDVKLKVVPLEYRSHSDYLISDHKPVSATYFFTVYKKPLPNPVQFERQKVWKKDEPHQVMYVVSKFAKTSSSDWIGLYRGDFYCFEKFESYTSAIEGAEKNRHGVVVTFSSRALSVKPGKYCLCYMTSKYSLMGISNTFTIE